MKPLQFASGAAHVANNEALFAIPPVHVSRQNRRLSQITLESSDRHFRQWILQPKFVEYALPDVYRNELEHSDQMRKVRGLAREWFEATAHLARASKIRMHPNFSNLINLGSDTTDWAIEQLRGGDVQYHWLLLLKTIFAFDPTAPEHVGRASLQARDWLAWHDGAVRS